MDAKQLENVILKTAKNLESVIDDQLKELSDVDELAALKFKRIQELKQQRANMLKWKAAGHGKLIDVLDEKDFFTHVKQSERVICHFYSTTNKYCGIVDEHLARLAKTHIESKFIKVNAEKAPFLAERFKLWMLPTIMLIKDGRTDYSIVGLDDLGGAGFKTSTLEKILIKHGVLHKREQEEQPTQTRRDDDDDDDDY